MSSDVLLTWRTPGRSARYAGRVSDWPALCAWLPAARKLDDADARGAVLERDVAAAFLHREPEGEGRTPAEEFLYLVLARPDDAASLTADPDALPVDDEGDPGKPPSVLDRAVRSPGEWQALGPKRRRRAYLLLELHGLLWHPGDADEEERDSRLAACLQLLLDYPA